MWPAEPYGGLWRTVRSAALTVAGGVPGALVANELGAKRRYLRLRERYRRLKAKGASKRKLRKIAKERDYWRKEWKRRQKRRMARKAGKAAPMPEGFDPMAVSTEPGMDTMLPEGDMLPEEGMVGGGFDMGQYLPLLLLGGAGLVLVMVMSKK